MRAILIFKMVLQHLSTLVIEKDMKITLDERATHFSVRSGKLRQYEIDFSQDSGKFKKIPFGARSLMFGDFEKHAFYLYYGVPRFYDLEGNVLKQKRVD